MKNLLLFAFILSAFAACTVQYPVKTEATVDNKTYHVDYLFEYEGVNVYRFYDGGDYVYFTRPAGVVTAIRADSTKRTIITIQEPE